MVAAEKTIAWFRKHIRLTTPGRSFRLPLRWQIVLIMLPLIFLPVMVVSIVGRSVTEQGLTLLVTQNAQDRANRLAQQFSDYYAKTGSWTGVLNAVTTDSSPSAPPWLLLALALRSGELNTSDWAQAGNISGTEKLPPPPPSDFITLAERFTRRFTPEQILITDPQGSIVATDGETGLGDRLAKSVLDQGIVMTVNGKPIGVLVIGGALGILNRQQSALIDTIDSALLIAALIAGGLTVLAGLWLSWQITHPAQQLMIGVQRLARGEWGEPLTVRARNEFGELTHAFNQMASEVIRQEQLRRQMVADVAHDLRTPLSAMQLEIEALEAGFQSPKAAAASLREEVEWLQHLIDDLRLLSLMDADQISLNPVEIPLDRFLADLVDFWQPLADDSQRTLALEASSGLPSIPIDVQRMRRAVGNLLDNALRYTRPGGKIVVRGCIESASAPDHTQAVIQISDDGEGIAASDAARIFERFYRVNRARAHDSAAISGHSGAPGSGLGLSIAQRLVELHGGTIGVESEPGHGATFTIRLPMVRVAAPEPVSRHTRLTIGDLRTAGSQPNS